MITNRSTNIIFIFSSTTELCFESKFNTVLYAKNEGGEHFFETQANNSTAKSPMGCFDSMRIPNDMKVVVDALRKYEEEE